MNKRTDLSRDCRRLLDALPEDASPVGNIGVRRDLGWSDDHYRQVRRELIEAGLVAAKRGGRGGSVQRLQPTEASETATQWRDVEGEGDLYEPFKATLEGPWASLEPYEDYRVEVTAFQGRRQTGRLSRPDLAFVGYLPHQVLPWGRLDVVTFEIKRADQQQTDASAAYQTLAYKRFSHRAYLAIFDRYHTPQQPMTSLGDIEDACRHLDIGLIAFNDPGDIETWDVRYDPPESQPDETSLDEFVAVQLPDHIDDIKGWLTGKGPA